MTDVFIAGLVTHDRQNDGSVVAGGSAYYGAMVHEALGARVTLFSRVGVDFECDRALDGVSLRDVSRRGQTLTFTNIYTSAGREQYVEQISGPLAAPVRLKTDVLQLAPVFGELNLTDWTGLEAKLLVVNAQGWLRRAEGGRVVPGRWEVTARSLSNVDVVCLSHEDLVGQGDLLDRLRASVPVVALTGGRTGSTVYHPDGEFHVSAWPTREVDPTGAGDTYAAALAWSLARDVSLEDSARFASAAASIVVEAEGASALSRLDEASSRSWELVTAS